MPWEVGHVWLVGDKPPTPSQVKRAGDRIRRAVERGEAPTAADLRLLDVYRAWHSPIHYQLQLRVGSAIADAGESFDMAGVTVVGRPLKTPEAIIAKLVRERGRLNRIQDIAGARIVVPNLEAQEAVLRVVLDEFLDGEATIVKDARAEGDELGYRGVHVVVLIEGRYAEIQIRTGLQGLWAQIVERLDEDQGTDLKHGSGPEATLKWLKEFSQRLTSVEYGDKADVRTMLETAQAIFLVRPKDTDE